MENKALEQYLHDLKRALVCPRREQMELLARGRVLLESFLEENPESSYETLSDAFGPPEIFAGEMLSTLDQEKLSRSRVRRRWLLRGAAAVALAAVLCAAFWPRQPGVVEEESPTPSSYVVEESPQPSYNVKYNDDGTVTFYFQLPHIDTNDLLPPPEESEP